MSALSSIDDIIADAKQGKMFILVDDEQRENEGDLVIPAQVVNASAINFMAKYGRGLICLALTRERVEELGLPPMARHNNCRHQTAFTVSIEAREGVTTGISAADRAHTIAVAIDPRKTARDIVTPGHIFPLEAREGGVLVRAGHTEAAVDIARLAHMQEAGVICEIMNDDGTMARFPQLVSFAEKHQLKIGTIADLIAYRRKNEKLVQRQCQVPFYNKYGHFTLYVYVNTVEYAEHIVLVKGDIDPEDVVLVRMHVLDVLADALQDTRYERHVILEKAMELIAEKQQGVIVLIREPERDSVSRRLQSYSDDQEDHANLRDYGIGAQILLDLGVRKMALISKSTPAIVGLEGYGLQVKETIMV